MWTPDKDKRVYATPAYSATEIRGGDGVRRTAGQPTVPYLLDAIRERVVHPMAKTEEMDGAQPDLRTESFVKVKLDCIMLDEPIKNVAFPPMGLFPTYCLDQKLDLLCLSYRFGSESAVLNTIGTFQGRKVALDPSISIDGVRVVSAHIETLDGKSFDQSIFASGPELEEHSTAATKISAAVMAGLIVTKVFPIYPEIARQKYIDGVVHLAALIGTDGHIHRLRVIDAPDPSLAISALAAVRQWLYKPYLLNGVSVEVDTTIVVHYNFTRF